MKFKVIQNSSQLPVSAKRIVYLRSDDWDDWFKYSTMYNVFYYDAEGERHQIGDVKIGEFNMAPNQRRASIPNEFEILNDEFFHSGRTTATTRNSTI